METPFCNSCDDEPATEKSEQFQLYDYWCITLGSEKKITPTLQRLCESRLAEIRRRYRNDQRESAIEIALYVFELIGLIAKRAYHIQTFETVRQAYEDEGTPEAIDRVSEDLEALKDLTFLRKQVVDSLSQASALHSHLDKSGKESIRQSTGHFIGRKNYEGQLVPERLTLVPAIAQIRNLEAASLVDKDESQHVEEVLRIMIAMQEDIELPEPPTQLTSVE